MGDLPRDEIDRSDGRSGDFAEGEIERAGG